MAMSEAICAAPHPQLVSGLYPRLAGQGSVHDEPRAQVDADDAKLVSMHGMGVHPFAIEVVEGDYVTEIGELFPPGLKMPLVATVSGPRKAADSTVFVCWSVCKLMFCALGICDPECLGLGTWAARCIVLSIATRLPVLVCPAVVRICWIVC